MTFLGEFNSERMDRLLHKVQNEYDSLDRVRYKTNIKAVSWP